MKHDAIDIERKNKSCIPVDEESLWPLLENKTPPRDSKYIWI